MSKKYKVKPTEKQKKALALMKQGVEKVKAMKQAGYSDKTAEAPGQNLLRSAGGKVVIEQQLEAYAKVGITSDYLAAKHKEWLEATKIHTSHTEPDKIVPDYDIQLKAAENVREDMGMKNEKTNPTAIQINFNANKYVKER